MHTRIMFVLAATAAGTALAQAPRPDPSSPRGKAPPLEYRSAFDGYQAFKDEPQAPWRESNEAVKDEGGAHAGHGQAAADEKPAPKPPSPGDHGDHK